MSELMRTVAKFMFVTLMILIVGWTGWHTYSVLLVTTGDPIQAVYGLIIFEGGLLTWFWAFQKNAESIVQHAVALFGVIIGVILVGYAFYISMQVDPKEIASYGSTGRWLIVFATMETLVFVLLYELFSPKIWEHISDMMQDAMLHAKADRKATQMIEKDSDELAQVLAQNRKDRVYANARIVGIKPIPQAAIPVNGNGASHTFTATVESPPLSK